MSNKPTPETRKRTLSLYIPAFAAVTAVAISLPNSIAVLWSVILMGVIVTIVFRLGVYLKILVISAFLLRVVLIFADASLNLLPYRWDDYYHIAVAIKQNIIHGTALFSGMVVSENTKAYSLLSSLQYLVFGDINLIVKITNAFFAVLVIYRIYQIALKAFENKKAAVISGFFFAFLPSYIVFSSLDMRDSFIIFLSVDIIYRVIQYGRVKKGSTGFFLIVEMGFMFFLRPQNIGLYIIICSLYVFVRHISRRSLLYKSTLISFVVAVIFVGISWLDYSGISGKIFLRANAILNTRAVGGSAYLAGFHYHTWADIFKNLPVRFAYFTFGPFPWDIKNLFMFMSFMEVLFVSTFFVLTLRYYVVNGGFNNIQLFLIIFGITGLAANSLFDSNYGTAVRHRLNYTFVFLMFGSAYLQQSRARFKSLTKKSGGKANFCSQLSS